MDPSAEADIAELRRLLTLPHEASIRSPSLPSPTLSPTSFAAHYAQEKRSHTSTDTPAHPNAEYTNSDKQRRLNAPYDEERDCTAASAAAAASDTGTDDTPHAACPSTPEMCYKASLPSSFAPAATPSLAALCTPPRSSTALPACHTAADGCAALDGTAPASWRDDAHPSSSPGQDSALRCALTQTRVELQCARRTLETLHTAHRALTRELDTARAELRQRAPTNGTSRSRGSASCCGTHDGLHVPPSCVPQQEQPDAQQASEKERLLTRQGVLRRVAHRVRAEVQQCERQCDALAESVTMWRAYTARLCHDNLQLRDRLRSTAAPLRALETLRQRHDEGQAELRALRQERAVWLTRWHAVSNELEQTHRRVKRSVGVWDAMHAERAALQRALTQSRRVNRDWEAMFVTRRAESLPTAPIAVAPAAAGGGDEEEVCAHGGEGDDGSCGGERVVRREDESSAALVRMLEAKTVDLTLRLHESEERWRAMRARRAYSSTPPPPRHLDPSERAEPCHNSRATTIIIDGTGRHGDDDEDTRNNNSNNPTRFITTTATAAAAATHTEADDGSDHSVTATSMLELRALVALTRPLAEHYATENAALRAAHIASEGFAAALLERVGAMYDVWTEEMLHACALERELAKWRCVSEQQESCAAAATEDGCGLHGHAPTAPKNCWDYSSSNGTEGGMDNCATSGGRSGCAGDASGVTPMNGKARVCASHAAVWPCGRRQALSHRMLPHAVYPATKRVPE